MRPVAAFYEHLNLKPNRTMVSRSPKLVARRDFVRHTAWGTIGQEWWK
jgi:hypothetical protein